jgi:hypothetical protein
MTPFDKVKNQLLAKIKEIYLPDEATIGGVINKVSKLDFTGGDAAIDNNKGTSGKDSEDTQLQ